MHQPRFAELATLGFTYFAVGVTVSVALVERGVDAGLILGAALLVYSATSELAYVAVSDADGPLLAGVLSGWLVASRFGVLAATLGTRLERSRGERAAAAINSFDPNVALAVMQRDEPAVRRVFWRVTSVMMAGWWVGSIVGLVLGNVLGDTSRLGLDAVFPAALLAIVGGLLRRPDALSAAVVAATVTLVTLPLLPAGVPILLSVSGALAGLAVARTMDRRSMSDEAAP